MYGHREGWAEKANEVSDFEIPSIDFLCPAGTRKGDILFKVLGLVVGL